MMKHYRELQELKTFEERYEYLKLNAVVGDETFGFDRWLNQKLYTSQRWRSVRDQVIVRDNGCDLGIEGNEIFYKIIIHHINPISVKDFIESNDDLLFDLDNLICVSDLTHRAIHYGNKEMLPKPLFERRPNDTCPWKE